jgi:hypothetical protein
VLGAFVFIAGLTTPFFGVDRARAILVWEATIVTENLVSDRFWELVRLGLTVQRGNFATSLETLKLLVRGFGVFHLVSNEDTPPLLPTHSENLRKSI